MRFPSPRTLPGSAAPTPALGPEEQGRILAPRLSGSTRPVLGPAAPPQPAAPSFAQAARDPAATAPSPGGIPERGCASVLSHIHAC